MASGVKYEVGSFEEGLAILAIQRRAELEFLKVNTIVKAIISGANIVAAAVTGGESGGLDSLNKSIDSLKGFLLPHLREETDRTARRYKETLKAEMDKGPITVKVVGRDKNKKKKR